MSESWRGQAHSVVRSLRVPVRAGAHHYVTLGSCMLAEVTEATASGLIAQTKSVRRR